MVLSTTFIIKWFINWIVFSIFHSHIDTQRDGAVLYSTITFASLIFAMFSGIFYSHILLRYFILEDVALFIKSIKCIHMFDGTFYSHILLGIFIQQKVTLFSLVIVGAVLYANNL